MFLAILNINWSVHLSKERLYGNLVQITSVIKEKEQDLQVIVTEAKMKLSAI